MSETRVTFTLNELTALLNDHADGILRARFDMTYSQFVFLACLQVEARSLTDAARMQGVSVAAVSKRVPWFVERGLIKTNGDAAHGRRVLISLTPKGRRLLMRSSSALEQAFRDLFVNLVGIDLDALNETLQRITTQLALKPKESA